MKSNKIYYEAGTFGIAIRVRHRSTEMNRKLIGVDFFQ